MNKAIKIISQIIFFLWIPESFSVTLYALRLLARSAVLRQFDAMAEPAVILLGTAVAAVFFGRYYCGYICSFGAMQDLSYGVRGFLFKDGKKYIMPKKADTVLSKIKYVILVIILILAVLEIDIPHGISPWTCFGRLTSFVKGSFDMKDVLTAGLVILLAIVWITAFYFRAFCRYLCPVGAVYSLVSVFSHDRRNKPCKNSGDCSICPYKCAKYRIHYPGLIAAFLIFAGTNLYLTYAYSRPDENTATTEKEILAETAEESGTEAAEDAMQPGPFKDGTYEGSGSGYKGEIDVSVTVENGYIVSVEVTGYQDDDTYFNSVRRKLIGEILETQSTDVDAVSGATLSSSGLIEAVNRALDLEPAVIVKEEKQKTEISKPDLSHLEDGEYTGTGIGFRGEIEVAVTVRDHAVETVRIVSYYDNEEYLFHASQPVIDEVVSGEPLDVDAVSGATYSSNALTRAIADALQVDEDCFVILEARPRQEKNKEAHHVTQKFIESDEQYEELVRKYGELMYGADGMKIKK